MVIIGDIASTIHVSVLASLMPYPLPDTKDYEKRCPCRYRCKSFSRLWFLYRIPTIREVPEVVSVLIRFY